MTPHSSKPENGRPRRLRTVAGAGLVLAVVLVASAVAERADTMGKTKRTPKPDCPGEFCQVNGQVTGFQRSVDGKKSLFRAPKNGRIVAWGLDLSKPSKEERETFGELAAAGRFGEKPTAGISILGKRKKKRYRLVRKSPVLDVKSYLGESPIFTLRGPLRIKKGQIVALTTLTWLPNFAADNPQRRISNKNAWVGSRTQKDFPDGSPGNGERNCDFPSNVPPEQQAEYFFQHSSPQKKVGSERKYGCVYHRARLLYYAYFVPNN